MTNLQNPIFNDEDKARAALEAVRWPNGPVCPHCGNCEPETMPLVEGTKRSHRPGLRYCNACKGQFTVTVGTVFERSKIPLSKWWLAMHLMGASKKGISAHQLWRMLGFGSYRTAWFMAHRIREAMKDTGMGPIGGEGKTVEADETYFGKTSKCKRPRRLGHGRKSQSCALFAFRGGNVKTASGRVVSQFEIWGLGTGDAGSPSSPSVFNPSAIDIDIPLSFLNFVN